MLRSRLSFIVAVIFLCPSLLSAAKVKVWYQHTPAQYDKAQLKQMVVSSEGTLRLSRRLRPLAGLDAAHVWDMVEDRDGNLYVATGDEGKIYTLPPEGKPVEVYAGEQSQILCLAAASDGSIYAGTGPNGQILRIDPRGEGKLFCDDRRILRLVAGRRSARPGALRRHRAARAASIASTAKARRPSSTRRSRSTSSAWPPAPTACSTPAPTRAASSTASTRRARASCSTRPSRPRCVPCE